MASHAFVMNFARGECVDLDALAAALAAGRLGGAAIDAYTQEPPDTSHPIFRDPRVLFSPHSGADTTGSLLRMGEMVIEDVTTLLAGGRPARTLNPACYETRRDRP
jgi:D-3-phosphoglycerate dehydrogenase / 2-oxoglutarate reductase